MKEGKSFEMSIKIYFRRITSLFLCCLLVFCSLPVQVHASDPVTAASLAITGGQLAGAGLSGEAALSLAGPVGAVVGITLGALGVNAYVSQAAQEAGKTRTRFVLDKLVLWGAQAGYTKEQLYSKIAQGISVASDGVISLSQDTAKVISQFGEWLFTQEDTVIESLPTGSSTVQLGNQSFTNFTAGTYTVAYDPNGTSPYLTLTVISGSCFLGYFNGTRNLKVYSIDSCSYSLRRYSFTPQSYVNDGYTQNRVGQKLYYNSSQNTDINNRPLASEYVFLNDNSQTFLSNFAGSEIVPSISSSSAVDEVFTGTPESWAENKDVLNPSAEDTPVVLNPDLLNPIIDSLTDGQQATMSIIDYLQALQDTWDHALDDVQTAIGTISDSLTGIQEQIAVPQDAVENPTVTNPSVTPETTPILNPSDVNPGTAITGLSFDLTNIFPFCIPFDIYAALNLLDAEPVAPSYHFHLEWPYNIVIDFTIDLSPFNQVAAVARTMEILLFIIGLAVMTRSMFIRG